MKRRRNKRSSFKHRPDKSFTDKRRATELTFSSNGIKIEMRITPEEDRNDNDEEHEEEEPTGAKKKKAKNLLKVMKYHQRTRRVFKQREPMQ